MYDKLIEELRLESVNMHYEKTDCHLFAKAADAIEELRGKAKVLEKLADHWCNKVPKWIPVAEQLPPISEEVIVFADRTIIRIWSLERYHPTVADVFWEREDGYHEDVSVVTHWMPLPQPPKDGEA